MSRCARRNHLGNPKDAIFRVRIKNVIFWDKGHFFMFVIRHFLGQNIFFSKGDTSMLKKRVVNS